MEFFRLPDRPVEPPAQPRMPEWMGPPDNVLPGDVPRSMVVARTDSAVVWMHAIVAYPQGLSFNLLIRSRDNDELDLFDPMGAPFRMLGPHADEHADRVFRFGVEFADGRRVTTLDGSPFTSSHDPTARPERPVLMPRGGGGGGGTWDMGHWLWPLPPAGPVTFACEWPAKGIAFTKFTVDGSLFTEAAERAEVLWPDERPSFGGGAGGFFSYGSYGELTAHERDDEE